VSPRLSFPHRGQNPGTNPGIAAGGGIILDPTLCSNNPMNIKGSVCEK